MSYFPKKFLIWKQTQIVWQNAPLLTVATNIKKRKKETFILCRQEWILLCGHNYNLAFYSISLDLLWRFSHKQFNLSVPNVVLVSISQLLSGYNQQYVIFRGANPPVTSWWILKKKENKRFKAQELYSVALGVFFVLFIYLILNWMSKRNQT